MRKILFILLIIILIFVGFFVLKSQTNNQQTIGTTTPSPTGTQLNGDNCIKDQLEAVINTEGAAGSIYAKLVVTNKSNTECNIMLGNYITASFEANNISTNYMDVGSINQDYNLMPGKSVYSQVRYSNGPQCSEIDPKSVSFMYSTTDFGIDFMTSDSKNLIQVQSCKSDEEETIIEIWPVSEKEINV